MENSRFSAIVRLREECVNVWHREAFFERFSNDWEEVKLYQCNARIARAKSGATFILWSYDTVVAWYDTETNTLLEFGRYSATTYQHIRKFRHWLYDNCAVLRRTIPFEEVNLELENWYR